MIEPLGARRHARGAHRRDRVGGSGVSLWKSPSLAAALIVFSIGVFVYLLGLPLAIWPSL